MALAAVIYACLTLSNSMLPLTAALAVNTLLVAVFAAYIVRRDMPLESLPVVGRYFRKHG